MPDGSRSSVGDWPSIMIRRFEERRVCASDMWAGGSAPCGLRLGGWSGSLCDDPVVDNRPCDALDDLRQFAGPEPPA
jgi:hypothetical protein